MQEALGEDYQPLTFGELYPVTGSLSSYADRAGAPGVTLELGRAFRPHPSKMDEVSRRGVLGVLAFARALLEEDEAEDQSLRTRQPEEES